MQFAKAAPLGPQIRLARENNRICSSKVIKPGSTSVIPAAAAISDSSCSLSSSRW
jgi:hypothetical protein